MRLLLNMSIRAKLATAVLSAVVLMIAIGIAGLWGTHNATVAAQSIYENRLTAIDTLNSVRNYQNQIRINLLVARQVGDSFEIMAYVDKVNSNIFKIAGLLEAYQKRISDPTEKQLLDAFIKARLNFGRTGVMPMIDLLQADKFADADKLRKEVMDPAFKTASDAIDDLIKYQTDAAQAQFEKISKDAKIIRIGSIASIVLGALLALVMGTFIARAINRGVAELVRSSARLADGDLTTHATLEGQDELARVGASFNQMTEQFAHIIGEVNTSSDQVRQTADGLSAVAEQVAHGSQAQSERATQAAASVEDLNAAFKEIAGASENIVAAVNNARALSQKGNQVVESAVRGIERVSQSVSTSATTIADLGQRSQQIGQILAVIKDIADQTNLLALNAAIEAARAGEQGRGFAVVADEVRKLAERTTAATAEISSMIAAIQNDTQQAVNTMQQSSDQVREGVDLANQAGAVLKQISASIDQVVTLISQIASATRGQSQASDALTNTVEEIAQMAQDNRSAVQQAASATHEMVERAQHLQQIVGRFHLDAAA